MAMPAVLTNLITYGHVWTGTLVVGPNVRNPHRGTGVVSKQFIAYAENYEQSAHDRAMAKYVQQLGGKPRSPHRAQVVPVNNNAAPLTYYGVHGQEASRLAAAEMHRRWTLAANTGDTATVLPVGRPITLAVQGVRQANGFHYEVTMWYDVSDVYVAFHCYHP